MNNAHRCCVFVGSGWKVRSHNHITVLRRTGEWRGEEGWRLYVFPGHLSNSGQTNFLARKFNPCLASVNFCYTRVRRGGLPSKLYARVWTEVIEMLPFSLVIFQNQWAQWKRKQRVVEKNNNKKTPTQFNSQQCLKYKLWKKNLTKCHY